jgi:hypothetical protein
MNLLFQILSSQIDVASLVIAVTGYVIVFTALLLLFWFFSVVPRLIALRKRRPGKHPGREKSPDRVEGISGEETAAIAMALYLYLEEAHDQESGVLTIKRISRSYSPWSSKIYAVRNQFNRN